MQHAGARLFGRKCQERTAGIRWRARYRRWLAQNFSHFTAQCGQHVAVCAGPRPGGRCARGGSAETVELALERHGSARQAEGEHTPIAIAGDDTAARNRVERNEAPRGEPCARLDARAIYVEEVPVVVDHQQRCV